MTRLKKMNIKDEEEEIVKNMVKTINSLAKTTLSIAHTGGGTEEESFELHMEGERDGTKIKEIEDISGTHATALMRLLDSFETITEVKLHLDWNEGTEKWKLVCDNID